MRSEEKVEEMLVRANAKCGASSKGLICLLLTGVSMQRERFSIEFAVLEADNNRVQMFYAEDVDKRLHVRSMLEQKFF